MVKYELMQMSFDGAYVKDSEHDTIEQAEHCSADMGSRWFFFPLSVIVKGQTVVETGGTFSSDGEPTLSQMFKGRRLATVAKVLKKESEKAETRDLDWMSFELFVIENNMHLIRDREKYPKQLPVKN